MSIESFKLCRLYSHKSQNLIKCGFNFDNDFESEFKKLQDKISELYNTDMESMVTLMKLFNIPSSKTMYTLFKHLDIKARSLSEATSNANLCNRREAFSNKFHNYQHTSWNNEKVLLRSSNEINFAKELDENKVLYKVESLRIPYFDKTKNKLRVAIPDFYLPESNTIVEVKSTYWLVEEEMKNKRDKYLELGYSFKLCLDNVLLDIW